MNNITNNFKGSFTIVPLKEDVIKNDNNTNKNNNDDETLSHYTIWE